MQHRMRHQQHPPTDQDTWNQKPWHPRICGRRAVALRVDYATGNFITVAFVLPSGQVCKLRAIVIHCKRRGCGVQFLDGHPQSFAHLARYWYTPEKAG